MLLLSILLSCCQLADQLNLGLYSSKEKKGNFLSIIVVYWEKKLNKTIKGNSVISLTELELFVKISFYSLVFFSYLILFYIKMKKNERYLFLYYRLLSVFGGWVKNYAYAILRLAIVVSPRPEKGGGRTMRSRA